MSDLQQQLATLTQWLTKRWGRRPAAGLILGTGSGQVAEGLHIEQVFDYEELPFFPRSTALGHSGRMVCGEFANLPVVAMQGRFHLYEGYSYEQVTLPCQLLASLGIRLLMLSNAAGAVNPRLKSGEMMLIHSHLDLMFRTSPTLYETNGLSAYASRFEALNQRPADGGKLDVGAVDINAVDSSVVESSVVDIGAVNREPLAFSGHYKLNGRLKQTRGDSPYGSELMDLGERTARQHGFAIHRGVYAGLTGPNYETRAEYRMLRRLGADVAGMSTIPEVTVAAQRGLPVFAVSIVANVANPDAPVATSGREVIDQAQMAAPHLHTLFHGVLAEGL